MRGTGDFLETVAKVELGSPVGRVDLISVCLLIIMTAASGFEVDLDNLVIRSEGIEVGHILAIGIVFYASLSAIGRFYVEP